MILNVSAGIFINTVLISRVTVFKLTVYRQVHHLRRDVTFVVNNCHFIFKLFTFERGEMW